MNYIANLRIRKFLVRIVASAFLVSLCFGSSGRPGVQARVGSRTNGAGLAQGTATSATLLPVGGQIPMQTRPAGDIQPMSLGGPDSFGYTYDDSVALSWQDTTSGADTGLTGDGQNNATQLPLPFPFKYYENSYTSLYISAAGYLSFTDNGYWPNSGSLPSPNLPNNIIAPYWAPTTIGSGAWVHYSYGGSTPNRFFVVEWHNLGDSRSPDVTYEFETILYENGDIVFQYGTNTYNGQTCGGAAGIENSTGLDGMYYFGSCNWAPSNQAVRFYRPADSARVFVTPANQGQFTSAGGLAAFPLTITNTGTLGADTYKLIPASPWMVSLFAADGTTPLADTDSDGVIDTGSIAQAGALTITVKVKTPAGAVLGDANTAVLTARSKMDSSRSMTTSLKTAVPAPFVQGYADGDHAVRLDLAQPGNQAVVDIPGVCNCGENEMAIAKMTGETYFYAWSRPQFVVPPPYVPHSHIEYAILDNTGSPILPLTWLTTNATTTVEIYDGSIAEAVTPDGHIGILWTRLVNSADNSQVNMNLFFAILGADGQLVWGPTNLTNNSDYISYSDYQTYTSSQVSATGDNHFLLAWQTATQGGGGPLLQNDYAILDSAGNSVKAISQLPGSGVDLWRGLSANPVGGNQTILTWTYNSDVYYAVLDSAGTVTRSESNLTGNGQARGSSHAVLLSDGTTALAWDNYDGSYPGKNQLAFAILDDNFDLLWGPTSLNNPAAPLGNDAISITADGQAHAILTWSGPWSARNTLYYALLSSGGGVLTAPMAFLRVGNPEDSFSINNLGYGNAPYDITTPPTVVSITRVDPSPTSAASVRFTVKFSEPVTGVDASDFTFTTSGVTGASITGLSGSHATYTVTVNTGIGDGTLRLDLTDDDSLIDASGNPLGGAGTGNGDFTGGELYTIARHHIYLPLILRP